MALNFRVWRSRPLDSEELELATLVAIHPDRIREVPEKIRPRVGVAADAIKKGASWTRPFVPGSRNAEVKPLQVRTVAEAASRALGPSSPATPADIELALRRQGIDWVEPFSPGKPLVPYYGYGRRPRTYDYRVGRNITTETRPDRIPFQTLEQVFTGYDIAQTCARHILADLRSMPLQFSPVEGYNGKVEKEIAQARKFLAKPDGYHPWAVWLSPLVMDVLMYDAGTLWRDRDRAGRVTGVQWIDGTTIAPELDYFGFTPKPPAPAFQQFIQGIPWNWLTTDDIIYQPQWMVAKSPYGVAPIETVLINANTDVRLQMFFLQFFTAGAVPEMFIEAPADMTDPDSLAEFEETFNARLEGNQAARHGLQWLPAGSKPFPYKQIEQIDPKIAEYVMRRTIAAFGLVPQDLGVVQDVNRSTADTQMDTQFRISSKPNTAHYESIINGVLQDDLQLPVQVRFDDGREKEDRLMEAQAHQIYVSIGAESPDQVATDVLGLEVDPQHPVPRSIAVQGVGLVPLSYLMSVAGDIDPVTAAPVPGTVTQNPIGIAPAIVKPMNGGPPQAPPDGTEPDGSPPKLGPGPTGHGGPNGGEGRPPMPTTAQEPSSGGPVSNHPAEGAYGKPGYGVGEVEARGRRIKKEGITAATGIAGVDLEDGEDDEAEDLRRWRANARKQVARGRAPREFLDSAISPEAYLQVWENLQFARTREEIDWAFKETTPNPKGRPGPWGRLEEELTAFYGPVVLASLAGGLSARQVVERWLLERSQYPAMPKDSDGAEAMTWAYAELLGQPTPKLRETVGRIYRDSFVAGAKDGLTQLGDRAKRTPLASAVNRVDWSAWKPGEPLSNEDLQDTGYSRMLGQLNTWVPAMDDTTKRQIAQALQDGVDQGLGSQAIADKIDLVLHDPKRAAMIARTEVNRSMSHGSIETYRQHGIAQFDIVTAWDPCPICIANKASGPHPITDVAAIPPSHPNCLPGSVRVVVPGDVEARLALDTLAGGAISVGGTASAPATAIAERHAVRGTARAATEREFVGDLVVVKTALGHELSATPNHPIATASGWLPISALREGDHVLSSTSPEWVVDAVHPDIEDIPPTIQEVAESLPVAFAPMPTSAEDFHGDGADGEVYVVRTDGLLGFAYAALCEQHLLEKSLSGGDIAAEPLDGERVGDLALQGTDAASHGSMGGVREPLPFLGSGLGHAGDHPGTPVPGGDAMRQQDSPNGTTADSEGFCERLLALSPEIAADQVVSVKRVPFRGHVYNLETLGGWYIGNGIVTHNCRCTPAPVVVPGGA